MTELSLFYYLIFWLLSSFRFYIMHDSKELTGDRKKEAMLTAFLFLLPIMLLDKVFRVDFLRAAILGAIIGLVVVIIIYLRRGYD